MGYCARYSRDDVHYAPEGVVSGDIMVATTIGNIMRTLKDDAVVLHGEKSKFSAALFQAAASGTAEVVVRNKRQTRNDSEAAASTQELTELRILLDHRCDNSSHIFIFHNL